MPGFNSPQILFLNTWDQAERLYLLPTFKALRAKGYRTYVEPCAGAFVMPTVAAQSGWPPEQMQASDVSLFTSVLGFLFSGRDLAELGVVADGAPLFLEGDPVTQAATILYTQLSIRMDLKPEISYWDEVRFDLRLRMDEHIHVIREKLADLCEKLKGLDYRAMDIWEHLDQVADDPRAVVSLNPPTYKGGFEKFFDTDGRLTWAQPEYTIFDAATDVTKIMDRMKDAKALCICQQQQAPGNSAVPPVYARDLSRGQYVYILCNRPDELLQVHGGLKVVPRGSGKVQRIDADIIPQDHEVKETSSVQVVPLPATSAMYYRDLFTHKLDYKSASVNWAVLVDGFLAGIGGYDLSTLVRPYQNKWTNALLLTYAIGAPHAKRITRLVTLAGLCRPTVDLMLDAVNAIRVKQFITVELTPYPEAKGLRGIMKLESRQKDPKYVNKLTYACPVREEDWEAALKFWLEAEQKWEAKRQKA